MKWLRGCVAAFRFLTIIPLPGSFGSAAEDLEYSRPFFPLVGIVLGLTAAAAAWLLWVILPASAAAAVLVILLFSFSGALHLDGLADTADGFFSARSREKALEIMRDSRTGVMGVAAVVSILLLKVSGLAACSRPDAAEAAFLMVLAGRCSMVLMMALLPYVRPAGGLGARFYARREIWTALVVMTIFFILCIALDGLAGLVLAGLVLAAVLLFCLFCFRRIGGTTGDTLGAGCEIAEACVALFWAAGTW